MANIVSEIFDRIPHADGGFRRRLTSGILFLATVGCGSIVLSSDIAQFVEGAFKASNITWKDMGSTGILVILFTMIFTVGYLLEVLSNIVVKRLFSLFMGPFFYRTATKIFARVKSDTEITGTAC